MPDNSLAVNGWDRIDLTPDLARSFGLPGGTHGWRKIVSDGALVALVHRDDNGWALALTHVTHYDPSEIVPGRYPTWAEVYAARRLFIPNETVLMVAVLEPMSFALRLRWERVRSPDLLPQAPGLPTTVKCVQMYCESVTEDCVFGTQDVPNPTAGFPAPPPRDPVGPVPDAYPELGELDEDEDDDDDPVPA